jgi:hypothetical protein
MRDVIAGNAHPYNICMSLAYPCLDYDHPIHMWFPARDDAPGAGAPGRIPKEVRFFLALGNDNNPWFTIPAGAKRQYVLQFRINDRTDTPIGPAAGTVTEWIWTLRGYQQDFRRRYGRPDYRRSGGVDGRPIRTLNSSRANSNFTTTNLRGFQNTPQDLNPTTAASGGDPDGYFKFGARTAPYRGWGLERVMLWALSGFQPPGALPGDYDTRTGTGVLTLNSQATDTVLRSLREIGSGLQLGIYWGRTSEVRESNTWADQSSHPLNPSLAADVDRMMEEINLMVHSWGARMVGLDAFAVVSFNPGKGYRWLQRLRSNSPRTTFIPENEMPDILYTMGPTYYIEKARDTVVAPFWIAVYLNPGSEVFMQVNVTNEYQPDRAAVLAEFGLTAIASWAAPTPPDGNYAGLRAADRWTELGEFVVPGQYTTDLPAHA